MEIIVEMHQIVQWFPPDHMVLDHLNLVVHAGEKVQIYGPSGSGKTLLFQLIAGDRMPDEGKILRQGNMALIPTHSGWIPTFTVPEYMALPLIAEGMKRSEAIRRSMNMMEKLGIASYGNIHVRKLNAYEQAVIAVGQALLQKRKLIIVDTLSAELSDRKKQRIMNYVLSNLDGSALLWMSHHPVAAESFDRLLDIEQLAHRSQL